jgi:hypothetical protein
MTKTVSVDAKLLKAAKDACGARTSADAVRLGLETLIRHAANEVLRAYLGSEPDAQDVPRRREKPAARQKRKAA